MENLNTNSTTYDSNEEDEDIDTLSLSGLFMYKDKNIEFLVENRSMSHDFDQDFEFSSEMMITSHDSSNPVVFCGKLIQVSPQNVEMFERKKQQKGSKTKPRSWYVLMFGFGSSRYPKKMHIRDLRERQTSVKRTQDRYNGRTRSRGLIRFLGCIGAGTEIDHHI